MSATRAHDGNQARIMIDACTGASVFPNGFDDNALLDSSLPEANLMTATSDLVKAEAGGTRRLP